MQKKHNKKQKELKKKQKIKTKKPNKIYKINGKLVTITLLLQSSKF